MSLVVVPSLPASSFSDLNHLAVALAADTDELQVDIVDGVFVDATSWPFTENNPQGELSKLAQLPAHIALELDCMAMAPEQYFQYWYQLGVQRVVLHVGSTPNLSQAIATLHQHEIRAGIAFTNDIPPATITPYLTQVDFVQVMGIKVVGAQGQPFDERTLDTVQSLRAEFPNLSIAVDGSVNRDTIIALKNAGVDRFLPGSAVAKASDPRQALMELRALVA